MSHNFQTSRLTQYHKERRDNFTENFRLRIHRSLSWLTQAEQTTELDFKFISLWISFNAAYADELSDISGDRNAFQEFLKQICLLDKSHSIHQFIWQDEGGHIHNLLNTPYTFQPFWDFHNAKKSQDDWERSFYSAKKKADMALKKGETHIVLQIIFSHLYTLRNQLMHGGATYNSSVNRKQLLETCHILSKLIPMILQIMLENPDNPYWGKPFYPVVK